MRDALRICPDNDCACCEVVKARRCKGCAYWSRAISSPAILDNCLMPTRDAKEALDAARYRDALVWALGAHETDGFREPYAGDPPYWWRKELMERAGFKWDGEKFIDVGRSAGSAA